MTDSQTKKNVRNIFSKVDKLTDQLESVCMLLDDLSDSLYEDDESEYTDYQLAVREMVETVTDAAERSLNLLSEDVYSDLESHI